MDQNCSRRYSSPVISSCTHNTVALHCLDCLRWDSALSPLVVKH